MWSKLCREKLTHVHAHPPEHLPIQVFTLAERRATKKTTRKCRSCSGEPGSATKPWRGRKICSEVYETQKDRSLSRRSCGEARDGQLEPGELMARILNVQVELPCPSVTQRHWNAYCLPGVASNHRETEGPRGAHLPWHGCTDEEEQIE